MRGLATSAVLVLAAAALVLGRDRSWSVPHCRLWRGSGRPARVGLVRRSRARAERDRGAADLPLALDLLACALRAGAPPSTATAAVATAVRGPVGRDLLAVARATELGAPHEVAWQPLNRLINVAAVARTAARTAESGTRLATELAGITADLRAGKIAAADARVRRAGVLVVLPLGLCFLPAFVLIGVVPIVIGVGGSVLR